MESELLRKKHLARFSSDELCLLLEEMGFDSLDLRGFRAQRVSGGSLLGRDWGQWEGYGIRDSGRDTREERCGEL